MRPKQSVLHTEAVAGTVGPTMAEWQFPGHDALVTLVLNGTEPAEVLARVPGDLAVSSGQSVWVEARGAGRAWSTSTS